MSSAAATSIPGSISFASLFVKMLLQCCKSFMAMQIKLIVVVVVKTEMGLFSTTKEREPGIDFGSANISLILQFLLV